MAYSTPSRYVRNIFAKCDEDDQTGFNVNDIAKVQQNRTNQASIFKDVTNSVRRSKNNKKTLNNQHFQKCKGRDSKGQVCQKQKEQRNVQNCKKQQKQIKNYLCVQWQEDEQIEQKKFQKKISQKILKNNQIQNDQNKQAQLELKKQNQLNETQSISKQNIVQSVKKLQKVNQQKQNIRNLNKKYELNLIKKKQTSNIILTLSESESDDDDDVQQTIIKHNCQQEKQNVPILQKQIRQQKQSNIKNLILTFDSEESQNQNQEISQPIIQMNTQSNSKKQNQCIFQTSQKPQRAFILQDFQDQSYQETDRTAQHSINSNEPQIQIIRPLSILQLVKIQQKQYLSSPIPKGYIFQTIIKRSVQENNNNNIVYQIFDEATYSPLIQVKITGKGYQFYQCVSMQKRIAATSKNIPIMQNAQILAEDKRMIAVLDSNFFGTEFNCYQIKINRKEKSTEFIKNSRLATILYQTNLFGLKGPRKMQIFIPKQDYLIKGKNNLQNIYQIQQNNKAQTPKILKLINRSPKWNSQIGAFVLNFNGRVTVSSVKNFIITNQQSNKSEHQKVSNFILFGKVSNNVFNLDIKYPFSLVQGIAIALSSFHKKLACQ